MPGMCKTLKKSLDLGKLPILIRSPYKQKKKHKRLPGQGDT